MKYKPHKHADLIHQWADGAKIQRLSNTGEWVDVTEPTWRDDFKYRVKPDPLKVRFYWYSSCAQIKRPCLGLVTYAKQCDTVGVFIGWASDWIEIGIVNHE